MHVTKLTAHMPMDNRPISYLRPLRRRWGLSQKELAFLIGAKTATPVARIEGLKQRPSMAVGLAIELIFDTSTKALFPSFIEEIREGVHRRATDLYEELQGQRSRVTRTKLDFLEIILIRTAPSKADDIML